MPDEDVQDVAAEDVEAPESETPSTEGAPEEGETEETTSEEPEGEDAPPDEPSDEDAQSEAEADSEDDEDEAWKNFQSKFKHLRSDRDRRAAMGKSYWEKTRYASQLRRENEELKARLASPPEPKKDEPPAAPHPDIAKLDQRIQGLVQKDQAVVQEQERILQSLRSVDEEIIKWRVKAEDADEYNKALFEQKSQTESIRKATLLQRWSDLNDRREQLSYDVERLMSDRNWVEQFVRQEEQRKATEAESAQEFKQQFRGYVNNLIEETAVRLKVPANKELRQDLADTVRDKMTVALWKLNEAGVDEVDIPAMVEKYTQSYLKRNDLVGRTKFTETSKKKLAVASKTSPPATTPAPKPTPGKPMRIAQMTQGELTPAMQRARQYLASRGL